MKKRTPHEFFFIYYLQVCRLTGGQLYKYTYFQPDLDGERFLADLKHNLSRPIVFDAIMRVRTSTGVRPVEFFGSFYMANTTDTELAAINSDMAVACKFELPTLFSIILSHFNMKLKYHSPTVTHGKTFVYNFCIFWITSILRIDRF